MVEDIPYTEYTTLNETLGDESFLYLTKKLEKLKRGKGQIRKFKEWGAGGRLRKEEWNNSEKKEEEGMHKT